VLAGCLGLGAALLFFWLGATLVGGAPFARGAASRAGHGCIGVSAASSSDEFSDTTRFLDFFVF